MGKKPAKRKSSKRTKSSVSAYSGMLRGLVRLVEESRRAAARSVNALLTATYWDIGRRIVEHEQSGKRRAGYGEELLKRLAVDLTERFGRGFSTTNLKQCRQFYLAYPPLEKGQTVSDLSRSLGARRDKGRTAFDLSSSSLIEERFPLPWSAYVRLLSIREEQARKFYETEALRGGWSVRQLRRQINSQFYERTALSRNKVAMLTKGERRRPEDRMTADEEIKDPYVLEFLNLKDEYSESELEEALTVHLQGFLLELGGDFAFVARQRRLRIGDHWFRVDLVFFHRRLRCLVLIDLKIEEFSHADAGQMHMYLNYAREHWTHEDENPPVGLILCAGKDEALVRYSLEGLPNKVMAREYRTTLPEASVIAAELRNTRRRLTSGKRPTKKPAKRAEMKRRD